MRKIVVVAAVLCIPWALASQAFAICQGNPIAIGDLGGSYLSCMDGNPPAAYIYVLASPATINSGPNKITCEANDPANNCFQDSGVVGDGKLAIESDWSNPGMVGCPTDVASNLRRAIVVVQGSDGKGAIISVSPDPNGAHTIEYAFPWDDAASFFIPLACRGTDNARPQVVGNTSVDAASNITMNLHFNPPHVFTDCDTDSDGLGHPAAGQFFGLCDGFTLSSVALGPIQSSVQPCIGRVNPMLAAKVCKAGSPLGGACTADANCGGVVGACQNLWTPTGGTPDASGNAIVTLPLPADGTQCLFVGGTTNINGQASPAVTGYVPATKGAPPLPSGPKAENLKASSSGGKVHVTWSVSNDTGLAGFRLQTETKAKGITDVGTMVAGHGTGNYVADLSVGDFKGGKKVRAVAVLNDGSQITVDWVSF